MLRYFVQIKNTDILKNTNVLKDILSRSRILIS